MPLRLDNARALPTCPQQSNRKTSPSRRDSRLTTRLRRCQKPNSQNASRPGRHQIGMVGEIISESWARSNRYTRARSSESADGGDDGGNHAGRLGSTAVGGGLLGSLGFLGGHRNLLSGGTPTSGNRFGRFNQR